MIIVRFKGGLGNQMFQYAMYIALKNLYPDTPIIVDCLAYKTQKMHNGFELPSIYNVALTNYFFTGNSRYAPYGRYFYTFLIKAIRTYFTRQQTYLSDEIELKEDPLHLDPSKNYYFDGHWGSENYFTGYREQLLKAFTFRQTQLPSDMLVIKNIAASSDSVSIHIRRTDYLTPGSGFRDLTEGNYYPAAMAYIKERTVNPVFYIFSDDIHWCKKNLPYFDHSEHYYLSGNQGENAYKDIHLMSLCRHNIIANSTFSWWGGWLNNHPDKIVLCPNDLFHDSKKNERVIRAFYPNDWIKVKSI